MAALLGAVAVIAAVVVACSAGGSVGSGAPVRSGAPVGSGGSGGTEPGASTIPMWSAEDAAVAAVLGSDPTLRGFAPLSPSLVGQDRWYEVAPAGGSSFTVTLHIGWGDCEAGCMHEHLATYRVGADGQVQRTADSGDALPSTLLPGGTPGAEATIVVHATASPTCPVERPGQSGCEPAPVAGTVTVREPTGQVVATGRTDATGNATLAVPGGVYAVTVAADTGFPAGRTRTLVASVAEGASVVVAADFDTGIR